MNNRNMTLEQWYKWVFNTPSAYKRNPTSKDQCLLLHSESKKLFFLYVVNEETGVKTIVKSGNTRGIYDYLLNNYCNKPDTDKGKLPKINVYYSDHAVRLAMEKGIKAGDCYLSHPRALHNMSGRVVAETTMFRCINLRWTSYYFGYTVNDKKDLFNAFKDMQNRFKVSPDDNYKFGFTSMLKRKFGVKTYLKGDFCLNDSDEGKELQRMIVRCCNLGALIGAEKEIERYNIYNYDIDSAYIFHIFNSKFPSNRFWRIPIDEYKPREGYTHFMQAVVSMSIKTEYASKLWFPVSAGNVYDAEIINKTITITATNKIVKCERHILGLWEEDLEMIKEFYDVQYFQPICVYQFELMDLPDELKNTILDLYKNKTAKKRAGENYHTEKIILNRGGYGLWVTKRYVTLPHSANEEERTIRIQSDEDVPFQIGSYIVALQRKLLLNMMQKIGMNHIVAFHTDSIKTDINCDDIIKDYNNKTNIYEKLGHFEKKWKADRIYFFNSVRYKAETDKGLKIKHGGIDERDMLDIFEMDYDEITANTKITITLPHTTWINADNAIKHKKTTITSFGHMEEWMRTCESGELLAL